MSDVSQASSSTHIYTLVQPQPSSVSSLSLQPMESSPSSLSSHVVVLAPSDHPMQTRAKSGVFRPCHVLNLSHTLEVPYCAPKGALYHHWKSSMIDQYNALLTNRTWELVPF